MSKYTFFDWSALDRKSIINHVMTTAPLLVGQQILQATVYTILKNNIKSLAPFKVKKLYNDKVDSGEIYIGGSYYSYLDREFDRCIEITYCYNVETDTIKLTEKKLYNIAILIADTVLHEIMHMRQYRRREFKSLPDYKSKAYKSDIRKEQEYLGSSDEIDAYSFNIACELLHKFQGDTKTVIAYLNKPLKNHKYKNTWRLYLKAFEYNHNHPIIKKLKKKIISYLPAAKNGKPYKSNDWINW